MSSSSSASDLTLRIEHASGDVSELVVPTPVAIDSEAVTLSTIRTERALDRVARCEATVFRDEWIDVEAKLDRRNDELYVVDAAGSNIFGGRLDDWQFAGITVSVQIDSFERDPRESEPPPSFERSSLSDAAIAADLIDLMDAPITAGTIEETTSSIDYSATHTAPAVMLRELSGSTAADVRYRPDGTVDYLQRRGVDRVVTLSPASGAVISEPRIRRTMREDTTDVRVLSQSDDSVFEEAEAVSTGSDEREVWKLDEINSVSSSRLQARATRLANEVADASEYLEVETALDPDALAAVPNVGDRYTLELPASGIATDARVIEADRVIDGGGDRLERVLLSNRKLTLRTR
jgi:hypothetical protein